MYTPPSADIVSNHSPEKKRNSGLGIASFVLAIVSIVAAIAIFGYAGFLEISTEGGVDEDTTAAIMIGLAIFACIGRQLIGLILGVVGLFQSNRRRTFAAIGVGMNGTIAILIVVIIWFGMTYG